MSGRRGSLVNATLLAAAVAAVVLVTVVLPAEYGLDPLGTGQRLGLTGLSRTGPTAVSSEPLAFRTDRVRFELAPFESVEYKYRLARDGGVVFSWSASGELLFDLHAEPDGGAPGYAESFEQGRDRARNGTYIAPFDGIHGWFWENRGTEPVELVLVASGFFEHATEFRDGDQSPRSIGAMTAPEG